MPQISQNDIGAFFAQHFSDDAVKSFSVQFLPNDAHGPDEVSYHQDQYHQDVFEDEEDDLGYYPDGVKRTLTDDQIAMFRHSEMHALRRAAEKESETRPAQKVTPAADVEGQGGRNGNGNTDNLEDGELRASSAGCGNKKRRKKKGKNPRPVQREPKPDLRKRTWDVVEKGLDSLEYD